VRDQNIMMLEMKKNLPLKELTQMLRQSASNDQFKF